MNTKNKILIIGQAPPYQKQAHPYDTTMLYEWLEACGVSKEAAQDIFDFEAMSNVFPGFDENGGHLKPSKSDIDKHWPALENKLQLADKVILLGAVAAGYYDSMPRTWSCNIKELYLIHPSKRNLFKFRQNKEQILTDLNNFIHG